MECYRRIHGQAWERAPLWERHALERYQEIQKDRRMRPGATVMICTSRPDGSVFMVQIQERTAGVYTCMEEGSDQEVEMMWAPFHP